MSLPTAVATWPMAMNATVYVNPRSRGTTLVRTDGSLCWLLKLCEEVRHGFVEVVFRESLGIIYGKCGYKGNDHLPNLCISGDFEGHYLLGGIKEVLFHELQQQVSQSDRQGKISKRSPCRHATEVLGM